MKRIVVTPATDVALLKRLLTVLEARRGTFDQWRWWLVGDEADLAPLRGLAASRPWIAVDEMEFGRTNRARYHRLCHDPDSVYIRVDETVSWLAPEFFDAMATSATRAGVLTAHSNCVSDSGLASLRETSQCPTADQFSSSVSSGTWGRLWGFREEAEPVLTKRVQPQHLHCYAWSGRTLRRVADAGFSIGTDEHASLFRSGAAVTHKVNVAVGAAICFAGADIVITAEAPATQESLPAAAAALDTVVHESPPPGATTTPEEFVHESPPPAATTTPEESPPAAAAPEAAPPVAPKKRRITRRYGVPHGSTVDMA